MISQNSVFAAPMAGISDRAFREIAIEFGADGVFSEMISAKGLYYNDKKTAAMLSNSEKERPLFVQLFGHEPDVLEAVVERALSFGGQYIDLNSGCPAPKIINGGDGGALMKDEKLFAAVVERLARCSPVPISVKIRMGWDDTTINAPRLARIAQESGAAMVTIHGRTVKQGYTGKANWEAIAQVVQAVSIPVVGNGDIFEPGDAKEMLTQTGCTGVMLGRGLLGNPFLMRRTCHLLRTGELLSPPTAGEKLSLAKNHIARIVAYKGERIGIKEARKHAIWYVKGMHGSSAVKNRITAATTYDEMCAALDAL